MKFMEYIETLKLDFQSNIHYMDDGVCLLGSYEKTPPLAEHILFPPMPDELMCHLKESYKRTIPAALLSLYRVANGMDLFWTRYTLAGTKYTLSRCQLSIFGVPRTFTRDRLEPYNISIEDLSRPHGTPKNWLKFGGYNRIVDGVTLGEYALFVDVENGMAYSVNRASKKLAVDRQWNSMDLCLCALFESLENCKKTE